MQLLLPPSQVCLERAMNRAQQSGAMARSDDNLESFRKRCVASSLVKWEVCGLGSV